VDLNVTVLRCSLVPCIFEHGDEPSGSAKEIIYSPAYLLRTFQAIFNAIDLVSYS